MGKKSFEVEVEPEILKWARETAGYTKDQVSAKTRVSLNLLNDWETGKKKPTLVQLRKIAKIYKRPLAVFLLPEPPDEPPLPKDYRISPENRGKPLSPETRLAIRNARRLQKIAIELAELLNREISVEFKKFTTIDDPQKAASLVRNWLGITIEDQINFKDENEALLEWKKAIENKGILVFQMPMPIEETRGFSFTDDKMPVIVLNETDAINARIFSLFHELGHILLNEAGFCDMEQDFQASSKEEKIERFCNYFAGELLVPREVLLKHPLVSSHKQSNYWLENELKELSKYFKVSKEVILRRLVILGCADIGFYKEKKKEWDEQSRSHAQLKKKWARVNPPKKCFLQIGVPVISLVLDSYKKDKITYSDVSDYLSLRIKYIPKLEQLLERYL